MKTGFRKILIAVLLLMLCLLAVSSAAAEDWMAEARRMLTMINDFRTGGEGWYWNAGNTEKVLATGLSSLAYDLQLEEVAKVRAEELSVSFSHTRPDGSICTTAFPAGRYAKGENIACGYRTAEECFEAFQEENEYYEGQGHRRGMLNKTMTRVGLAAVEINGTVYWVQEFASGDVQSPLTSGGWIRENNAYYYEKEDGSRAVGWLQDGGSWYYMDASGVMQTGWVQDNGVWHYFDQNGAMKTGWMATGNNWYYMGTDGAMRTGWQEISNKWYYFSSDGIMKTEWQEISKKWYYFGTDGVMQTGWQKIDNSWYYFRNNGAMVTDWQEIQGNWYYFKQSGEMVTGRVTIRGQAEIFDASGVWQYSEIEDYPTALGIFSWDFIFRLIMQILRMIF